MTLYMYDIKCVYVLVKVAWVLIDVSPYSLRN